MFGNTCKTRIVMLRLFCLICVILRGVFMQIHLSSDGYDIINSGQVFLFGEDKDLKLEIHAENDFDFFVILNFLEDTSEEYRIEDKIVENTIYLTCINFRNDGTGLTKPVSIATIEGRALYFLFWSYLEGKEGERVRSVKYTFFYEK